MRVSPPPASQRRPDLHCRDNCRQSLRCGIRSDANPSSAPSTNNACDPLNLDILSMVHNYGVPVRLMHRSFIVIRILRAIVDDCSVASDMYVMNRPKVH